MFRQPNLAYDGTDYPHWYYGYPAEHDLGLSILDNYSTKEFLKDISQEKKIPGLIRFLNVFLYGAMIIVDWIEKRLKKEV